MKFSLLKSKLLNNWTVKIISLAAAVVLYYINYYNTLDTRQIDVPLSIVLPAGYSLSAPHIETVSLTAKGKKELDISKLTKDDFEAIADLSGETRIRDNESITVSVRYEKRGNALAMEPLSVVLKPQAITVKLEKSAEKWVKIQPDIAVGSPPEGYTVTGFRLNPDKILIRGPASRVNAIESVLTEPISFENRKKDFFLAVKPVFTDPYITTSDPNVLEFLVSISEIVSEREIYDISITALNINEQLMLDNVLPPGIIKVKAAHEVLANLDTNAVRMIINCDNINQQGKYTLRTVPEYPPGVMLVDYSPKEVMIDLGQRR